MSSILDELADDAADRRGAFIGNGVRAFGDSFARLNLVAIYEGWTEEVKDGYDPVYALILREDAERRGWKEGQTLRPANASDWIAQVRAAARATVEARRREIAENAPASWGAWYAAQDRRDAARAAARDELRGD